MTPEKFWSYVWKSPEPDGCWLWMGSRTTKDYPRFKENGKYFAAHRFALSLALGRPLKKNEQANHACNTPPCVRFDPKHIYCGNQKENIADAIKLGRMNSQRPNWINPFLDRCGVKSPVAKLNDNKIRLIRKLRSEGWSQQKIADMTGSTQVNVSLILRGKTWKHVI